VYYKTDVANLYSYLSDETTKIWKTGPNVEELKKTMQV